MSEERAADTADEERERREHEAEARERDPHERSGGGEGDELDEAGGPPGNIQAGTNTGS
jgi:hypothetical protein